MVDVLSSADTKALIAKKANQPPTAGSQGQVLTRDTSSTTGTSWVTPATGSGGGTVSDATTTSKGVVQLAGDLAGTAAAPTLKQINASQATYGSSTKVAVPTVDVNGRVVAVQEVQIAGVDNRVASSLKTGSYTLSATDAGTVVEVNSSSAAVVTVPNGVFSAGDLVEVFQYGAGQVSLAAGSGVTLRSASSLSARAQYSSLLLRFRSSSEAVVSGDQS